MSAITFFFVASLLYLAIFYLALAIYSFSSLSRPMGILYGSLCLSMFFCSASEIPYRVSGSEIGFSLYMLGWLLFFSFFLHFAVVFSQTDKKILPLIYCGSAVMGFFVLFTKQIFLGFELKYFGYDYIPGHFFSLYTLYYIVYILIGLFLIVRVYKAKEFYRRKQANIISAATFFPFVFRVVIQNTLGVIGIEILPLVSHFIGLTIWFVGYAIMKYSPVDTISRERIAENAARSLHEGLFLTDNDHIINYANPAACSMSQYRLDELQGKHLGKIISQPTSAVTILNTKKGKDVSVETQLFPLLQNKGFLYIARDLTNLIALRELTRKTASEQTLLLIKEEAVIHFLFRFLEAHDMKEVENYWEEILGQSSDIVEVLAPVYKLSVLSTQIQREIKDTDNMIKEKDAILEQQKGKIIDLEKEIKNLRQKSA